MPLLYICIRIMARRLNPLGRLMIMVYLTMLLLSKSQFKCHKDHLILRDNNRNHLCSQLKLLIKKTIRNNNHTINNRMVLKIGNLSLLRKKIIKAIKMMTAPDKIKAMDSVLLVIIKMKKKIMNKIMMNLIWKIC